MNEYFDYLLTKLGPLQAAKPVLPKSIKDWHDRLPGALVEFWEEHGIGMWANGKFQLCDPDEYAGLVKILLGEDKQFSVDKTYIYGFSAFGELLLWNEIYQNASIDLVYQSATAACTKADWTASDPNAAIMVGMMKINDNDVFTLFEDKPGNPPLFKKCLKALGHVELGECYGMFPALPLGGTLEVASFKKVRALEHFGFLAQLGPISLMDYSGGKQRFVRHLNKG